MNDLQAISASKEERINPRLKCDKRILNARST